MDDNLHNDPFGTHDGEKMTPAEFLSFLKKSFGVDTGNIRQVKTETGEIHFTNSEQPVPGFETKETSPYEGMHSVVINFNYGLEEDEPFYELVDKLMAILSDGNVGIYDGHEMAMDNSDGSFYMYGKNAETLFKAVLPILKEATFMGGATAELRFGTIGEDVPKIEVEI